MSAWESVPQDSLPKGALNLNTYAPDATQCVKGHPFTSEADCILPEDEVDAWDYFLCRACVLELPSEQVAHTYDLERPFEQTLDEAERTGD